jgi:preprotein translocase subunit Sec63
MAFEVFDDVAFYWFLMAALFAFVIPMTRSFYSVLPRRPAKSWTREIGSCTQKIAAVDARDRKETMSKVFGWRGVGFTVGWVMFISLAVKLTSMEGQEMFTFNPYKILGVEEGAEMGDVKKAYRRLSLQYHPDKNQGNPEANDLFIKVAKAYEVLTDDATRENYEKYGNPDGYHGTSVTIGLPSWLTNKDNELAILVAYFLVIIIVIPVVVGLWWRNSSKFLEDGVMHQTVLRFWKQVQDNTATKYIPGVIASAVELCEGAACKNSSAQDLQTLHRRVSPNFVKNQARPTPRRAVLPCRHAGGRRRPPRPLASGRATPRPKSSHAAHPLAERPPPTHTHPCTLLSSSPLPAQGDISNDIMKVKTLLYAHLLREEVPKSLQEDMLYVLEHSHRLLNALLNVTMEQRFVQSTMNVIECSQLLTQGLWFHSNQLLQLPHFEQSHIKQLNKVLTGSKSGGSVIDKVKELGGPKRREVLTTLSEDQHMDIDVFLMHFPEVEITFDAKTEDEADVQEGDVLNLVVKVERKHLPDDPNWADSDDEDDEPDESVFEEQLKGLDEDTEEYETKREQLMDEWRDAYFERAKTKREREKARNPQSGELGFAAQPLREPVPAHAPLFPFVRNEQWMVLLVDQKTNKLIGYQKLTQNTRYEKVALKFLAPKEGVLQYDIHCLCSSYLGCDKKVPMKKTISKKVVAEKPTAAEIAEDEDDEEEEAEEEPEGKWYYLGGNSVGELILNIIALVIAGVMLFNFLYAKGWWQKFCQPLIDWILKIAAPLINFMSAYTAPAWLWWTTNVYDFRHVAFMFENLTAVNETNASISLHVRKNDTSFLNQDPFKQDIFAEARENL